MLHDKEQTVELSCRISVKSMQLLDEVAKATERSPSSLAAQAIQHYLDQQAWEILNIHESVKEADSPDAVWISNEEMGEWIKSLRTDNPKPRPL